MTEAEIDAIARQELAAEGFNIPQPQSFAPSPQPMQQPMQQQAPMPQIDDAEIDRIARMELQQEMQQQPQASLGSELKGIGGSAVRGSLDLAGLVTDVMKAPGVWYMNNVQGQDVPYFDTGQKLQQMADPILPAAPQTNAGKIAGSAGRFMAGAVGGKAQKGAQLASAAISGGLSEYAKQKGVGAGGQFVTALLGGMVPGAIQGSIQGTYRGARAAQAALQPDRAKAVAAREIQNLVGDDKTAALKALENFKPKTRLDAIQTTAEATQSPMLSHLEADLARSFDPMKQNIATRATKADAIRKAMIEGRIPDEALELTNSTRGDTIRQALSLNKDVAKAKAQALYDAVDPAGTTKLPLKSVQDAAEAATEKFIGTAGEPIGGRAKSLINAINSINKPAEKVSAILDAKGNPIKIPSPPQTATIGEVSKLASRAGDVAGQLGKQGKNQAKAVITSVRESLRTVEKIAAETGEGMTSQQLETLRNARGSWKSMKDVFDSGASAAALKADEFGRYKSASEKVMQQFVSSPESAKQFMRAAKDQPEAVSAMRAYLATTAREQTPFKFNKLLETKGQQLKTILGTRHYSDLQNVSDFLKRQATVTKQWSAPSRGQSITAQKKTIDGMIENIDAELGPIAWMSEGRLAKTLGVGAGSALGFSQGGVLGAVILGAMTSKTQQAAAASVNAFRERVFSHIMEASMSPEYAKTLLTIQAPAQIKSMATEILKGAAQGAARGAGTTSLQQFNSKAPAAAPAFAAPQPAQNTEDADIVRALQGKAAAPQTGAKAESISKALQQVTSRSNGMEPPKTDADFEALIGAQIQQESAGKRYAVSNKGAKGIMQLMDATGKEYHRRLGIKEPYDPFDVEQNKTIGVAFMRDLFTKYGDTKLALAGYNWGETRLDKLIKRVGSKNWDDLVEHVPNETADYVPKIIARLNRNQTEIA